LSVEDEYKELMIKHGIKNTKQREMIYEILEESDNPVTAEDIFLKLKEGDEDINLSTVYRNLEMLCAKGIVSKSNFMNDDKARFELSGTVHKHHLICLKCNKMIKIDGCPLERLEKVLQDETSFDITGHKLEIYGYCPECKKSKK
jgi:Fur family ferric uptake transcriptional regulator